VDAGSVLGVPAVRSSLLDDVSSTRSAETESDNGADDMMASETRHDSSETIHERLADDLDDELDDEFDDDGDEEDEDDDEQDEDDEDAETWQVFAVRISTENGGAFA
jgi:hypothetical protein